MSSASLKFALALVLATQQAASAEQPTTVPYEDAIAHATISRQQLGDRLENVGSQELRGTILHEAAIALHALVAQTLIPPWYGTPWDFNGTSTTPGEGTIACGYFVSTILSHAGFEVERVRMAQQPSELIIRSLCQSEHISRFSDVPLDTFLESVRAEGDGLYIVGLDIHVGFLSVEDGEVWFLHSSYQSPRQVVRERAASSLILESSRYRVVGSVTKDQELLRKWIEGESIATRTLVR